jgi:hypothetical protein
MLCSGHALVQLVEAPRSKPEDVTGIFINIILPAALWSWIDSASNRNEYQEYFLWVNVAGV